MTTLEFTAEELETLRVALLTAYYAADDEERALGRVLDLPRHPGEDADEVKRAEDGRAKAALRAMAYHILAERVMATQGKEEADQPLQ